MTVQSDEPIDGGSAVSLRDHLSLWIKRVEQSFADRLETVERVNTERDARYNERFMAAKTLVDQNSASSEKAILKAETAQRIYDSGHNDLLAKMDKQQQLSMPRGETEAKIAAVEARCAELRKEMEALRSSRDFTAGSTEGITTKGVVDRARSEFNLTTIIAIISLCLALFLVLRK